MRYIPHEYNRLYVDELYDFDEEIPKTTYAPEIMEEE